MARRKTGRKALGLIGGAAIKRTDDADMTMVLTVGEGHENNAGGAAEGGRVGAPAVGW
jgi:hypothetical protein